MVSHDVWLEGTATAEAPLGAECNRRRIDSQKMGLPARIGRFPVSGLLGQGSYGSVYRAYDERLDRPLAIKVLRHSMGEASARRLLTEARALAKLDHLNVVRVFEIGQYGGAPFIAMELIEGPTLRLWQVAAAPSWQELLDVYLQAAEGLAAAHARGMVHRDFKPHNVMISEEGGHVRARVLDLGLVRVDDEAGGPDMSRASFMSTSAERRLGTPAYMAPEQYLGARSSAATDQFSFCVSLWEALHGTRPFARPTVAESMAALISEEPASPRRSRFPTGVRNALLKGLSVHEHERHASMRALIDALRQGRKRSGLCRLHRPALAWLSSLFETA